MVRVFRGSPAEDEADRLMQMTAEDHLDAAALAQGRASNPAQADMGEVAAAHEQRAQTHLLWAIALRLEPDDGAYQQGG